MTGPVIAKRTGVRHKSCGKGLKTNDIDFYRKWQAMRTRTTNKKYTHYNRYGGRGINSDEFKYFIDFYDAMYESYLQAKEMYPDKIISLERKDVNKNYTEKNCIWIPLENQHANMERTVNFELTYPDGTVEIGRNLRGYAIDHDLSLSTLSDLVSGRIKSYRGITGKRL